MACPKCGNPNVVDKAEAWDALAAIPPATEKELERLRKALEAVKRGTQVVPHTMMDAVLGPTYIIHGITLNKVDAALAPK